MKQIAIDKAQARLDKARTSLARIRASTSYADFVSAWTDFLVNANSVYTILEQGAKSSPQCRQWFGGKKKERRADPLLQYLHQARNADEHGLEPVSQLRGGSFSLSAEGSIHIERLAIDGNGNIDLRLGPDSTGKPVIKLTPATAVLLPVTDDRFGATFQPPLEHKGVKLTDTSPAAVAALGLVYHEALLAEAAGFVK